MSTRRSPSSKATQRMRRRPRFARGGRFQAGLVLLFALTIAFALPASAAKTPTLDFDWSMPDRFGLDENGDGLIDYFNTVDRIAPKEWIVDFVITSAPLDANGFDVYVDGVLRLSTKSVRFSLSFPYEDAYEVRVATQAVPASRMSAIHEVIVQDWLIVGVGDSYASGEGNPDIPIAGHLFDDYNRVSQNLRTFRNQLANAIQVATARQSDLAAVLAQTAKARAAKQAYDAAVAFQHAHCDKQSCVTDPIFHKTVCVPAPDLDCPGAVANSAAKLADLFAQMVLLGLEKTLSDIEGRLAQLESAARLALQSATTLVSSLQSIVAQTESDLANIRSQAKPVWQNADAHRSAWSGQAQAALRLEQADRRTSVTFVHLAVSGSVIADVIQQLGQLNVGGREIDALIVSGGGNDARFGPIIESLIKFRRSDQAGPAQIDAPGEGAAKLSAACDALPLLGDCGIPAFLGDITQSAGTMFAAALPNLPSRYKRLDDRLQNLAGFGVADILDIASLATRLARDQTLPAAELRHQLSAAMVSELTAYVQAGTPAARAAKTRSDLAIELQRIVNGPAALFDAAGLRSPVFLASDVALALSHPVGSSLQRLNHALLSEAFPLDIRSPARPITLSTRVYITEYPDASRDDNGQPCQASPFLPGVETPEWAWVAGTMIPQLNAAVRAGAATEGWRFVTGIYASFHAHGVCASDSWFNSPVDTLTHQGDIFGLAHPNRSGHQAYATAIFTALQADLYSGGLPRPPRPVAIDLPPPALKAGLVHFPIPTVLGRRYFLRQKPNLSSAAWATVTSLTGDGEDQILTDPHPLSRSAFYQVVAE